MMKIAGLTMDDVWAHRVLRERGVPVGQLEKSPADIDIFIESIELAHHRADQNYRPYLHVTGEIRAVRCGEPLPYGVGEVTFPPGGGDRIDGFYEFDNAQLAELVGKGYFTENFAVPDQVTEIEWELPATTDVLVLAPEGDETLPVVFVRVHDTASLSIDKLGSGYDLAEYFADYSHDDVVRHQEQVAETGLHIHEQGESLFTEDEVFGEQTHSGTEVDEQEVTEAVADGFEGRVRDIEADLEVAEDEVRDQLAQVDGSVENIYRDRVANTVETDLEEVPVFEPEMEAASETEVEASVDEHVTEEVGEVIEVEAPSAPVVPESTSETGWPARSEIAEQSYVPRRVVEAQPDVDPELDVEADFEEGPTEDELDIAPVQLGRRGDTDADQTRRDIAARAAALDHGEEDVDRQY